MTNDSPAPSDEPVDRAIRVVEAHRLAGQNPTPIVENCAVAVEHAATISIEDAGNYVLMCSPLDLEALAVGFACSEGLITGVADIDQLMVAAGGPRSSVVRMRLVNRPAETSARTLIVSTSCGICGSRDIEERLSGPPVGDQLRVAGSQLIAIGQAMRQKQDLFARTGAAHAAAVFDADCQIIAFAEDIGRHSALDKAIGKCLLAEQSTAGCGVMLSGRVSYELVCKAAAAGLEVVAAVSAPLSLAVEAATQRKITLCAFVRDDRATVYTHRRRITDCQQRENAAQ